MEMERVKKSAELFCDDLNTNGIDFLQRGYLKSYYYFLEYFHDIHEFESRHVVIGAGFTYSWMDTILSWRIENEQALVSAAKVLTEAKKIKSIDDIKTTPIGDLKGVVSDSYIGTSKLLHFVNPGVFPIYDSHICRYVHGEVEKYHVNTKKRFFGYIDEIAKLLQEPKFENDIYAPILKTLESFSFSPVSRVRAVEMAMFHHQRKSANKALLRTSR